MDGAHFFVLLFCSTCRVIYYGRGSAEASQFPVSSCPDGASQPASQHTNMHWKDTRRGERGVEEVCKRTIGGHECTHSVPVTITRQTSVKNCMRTHTVRSNT